MNGIKALMGLLIMKKECYLIILLGLFFVSNSIDAQTTKLPTNEELNQYFRDNPYPDNRSAYFKSYYHEFDAYNLDQSPSFKELCDHFLKIPSAEELEPIINEKIHFKLFRDDFKYWSIKCKLDKKEHSFLITGAGRIIHQSDNCNACKNIKTKRTQFKKQITEYIDYLKKEYGNLDNAVNELITSSTKSENQATNESIRKDSIREVYYELNKIWDPKVKLHPNNFIVGFEQANAYSNAEIKIYGYSATGNYTEDLLIRKVPAHSLILETNDALWFMEDIYSDLLRFKKSFYNGYIGKILKTGRIVIANKHNGQILVEFEPTIIRKNNGEIQHVQLAKFDSLKITNEQIQQRVDSIRRSCIKVPGNMFKVYYGNKKSGYFEKTYRSADLKSNMSNFSTGYYSVETSRIKDIQQFWFFESMKKQSPLMVPANLVYGLQGYPVKTIDMLLVYETDEYIYVGDEDLPVNIATEKLDAISDDRYSTGIIKDPLSPYTQRDIIFGLDNIIRVDKKEKPQLNIKILNKGKEKTVYKYKQKK